MKFIVDDASGFAMRDELFDAPRRESLRGIHVRCTERTPRCELSFHENACKHTVYELSYFQNFGESGSGPRGRQRRSMNTPILRYGRTKEHTFDLR